MVEKGMSCIKYLLFAFNLLFFIFGAVLIGVGAYAQIKLSSYNEFASINLNAAAVLVIIVGVVTFIVGFFGCCGAIKENHCMIMTFAVLIGLILICEIGAGIAGYVLKGKAEGLFSETMKSTMKNFTKKGVKESWDGIQQDLKCCGTNNYTDWAEADPTDFKNGKLPNSCCPNDGDCTTNTAGVYADGCLGKIENALKSNIGIVAGAGIGLAVVELIGIILSCCLARAVRNEYEVA